MKQNSRHFFLPKLLHFTVGSSSHRGIAVQSSFASVSVCCISQPMLISTPCSQDTYSWKELKDGEHWAYLLCMCHSDQTVSSRVHTTLIIYCPTVMGWGVLIGPDVWPVVASFFVVLAYKIFAFPGVFIMYALRIHTQGLLVVWEKRQRYYKVSKIKLLNLTNGKKKIIVLEKKKSGCVSLLLFPLLLRCSLALIWLL